MSTSEWIGVLVAVCGIFAAIFHFGRNIGKREKDIEHTDQSLQSRIKTLEDWQGKHKDDIDSISNLRQLIDDNESEIAEIMSKIEGGEFWERMKQIIQEVKSGTERFKRDQ